MEKIASHKESLDNLSTSLYGFVCKEVEAFDSIEVHKPDVL